MEEHDLYPGLPQGFSLVERDEHRHIAFGVRFLKDAVEQEPRYGERIETLSRRARAPRPPRVRAALRRQRRRSSLLRL